MTSQQAVVKLLDARGILYELKVSLPSFCIAASLIHDILSICKDSEGVSLVLTISLKQELAKTDPKSEERFQARKLLPGMAKSLRQVR